MAVDIGIDAVYLSASLSNDFTVINKENPASAGGTITSIELWANQDITGLRVGTFYTTNGNRLQCRDSEAIAGTITAGSKVTKNVSIAVVIGDYIGCYYTVGAIGYSTAAVYVGLWYKEGEYIDPGETNDFGIFNGWGISLGGYIGVVGWTGKMSGVTNPAKIMKVDVANIATSKGVA